MDKRHHILGIDQQRSDVKQKFDLLGIEKAGTPFAFTADLILFKKIVIDQQFGRMLLALSANFELLGIDTFVLLDDPICQ